MKVIENVLKLMGLYKACPEKETFGTTLWLRTFFGIMKSELPSESPELFIRALEGYFDYNKRIKFRLKGKSPM